MALKIVHYNDPVLRRKGEGVVSFDAALSALAADMIAAMHASGNGIGLAAQQVGRARQVCVVDLRTREAQFAWRLDSAKPPLDLIMPMVLVNPTVSVARGTPEAVAEEGCLSFPEIRGDVSRPEAITVRFQDERGVPHEMSCDGLLARCIQHEVDHLNGVLFIDRMDRKARAAVDESVKALARKTREERAASARPAADRAAPKGAKA
jgi:peptide deformylase